METITLSYSDFKAMVTTKPYLAIQSVRNPDGPNGERSYYVFMFDGQMVKYDTAVNTTQEVYDFEMYVLPNANRQIEQTNADGIRLYSPSLDDTLGLYPKKRMFRYDITPGETNIFDELIVSERRINGGEYWISNATVANVHEDDYVEFSVVDKNDTLGLFGTYGVPQGGYLELCKFVLDDYVMKGSPDNGYHSQLFQGMKGTNRVVPGLYMRTYYFSHGTASVRMLSKIFYYTGPSNE